MNTAIAGRMRALGRAELILLMRAKSALFTALAVPVLLSLGLWSAVKEMDLSGTGLSPGTVLLPGAMAFVLIFAIYSNLVGVYVVRREELVIKRLRTGELTDAEILAGSALPAVVVTAAQCAVLIVGGTVLLDLFMPRRPELLVTALVLGAVLMVAMAALTAAGTKSAEAAQLTPLPITMVSLMGSGTFIPLDVMPDRVATVCQFLPLTPVMELMRGGWVGGMAAGEVLGNLGLVLAWTALVLLAVRRWFRWEPRG